MNPCAALFSILCAIYLLIGIWAVAMGFTGSIIISLAGLAMCFCGRSYSITHDL